MQSGDPIGLLVQLALTIAVIILNFLLSLKNVSRILMFVKKLRLLTLPDGAIAHQRVVFMSRTREPELWAIALTILRLSMLPISS